MATETQLAAGYALLLAAVAAGLEWAARSVHRRAEQFETAGFTYHPQLDAWRCPTGQHLHRHRATPNPARVVYRAPAHACNRCHLKASCTDSDQGRTLETQPDAWVNSSMARFHRGLSLALLLVAELMLGGECIQRIFGAGPRRPFPWPAVALLLILAIISLRLARRFFARPQSD